MATRRAGPSPHPTLRHPTSTALPPHPRARAHRSRITRRQRDSSSTASLAMPPLQLHKHAPAAQPPYTVQTTGGDKITDEFTAADAIGQVCQVIGVVVDMQFDKGLPPILTSLEVLDNNIRLILEAAHHLGGNMVCTVAMDGTEELIRGHRVLNTGSPIIGSVC